MGEEIKKKPLTKKEKQALKKKELDDLNDILKDFGVAGGNDAVKEVENGEPAAIAEGEGDDTTKAKKKKKKRSKGKNNKKEEVGEEPASTTEKSTIEPENSETLDVAAVLRAKAKPKGKTVAEIAAATASKEAKAKKKAAPDKKKKKKKDKYAHGAPSR